MSQQIIPLTTAPNQSFAITLSVDGASLTLNLAFHYNEVALYWEMDIADASSNPILSAIPLVTGEDPACNLLKQYSYLEIGSAFLINLSGTPGGNPDNTNLGSSYNLIWGDTP
jgi:hypothetical protein